MHKQARLLMVNLDHLLMTFFSQIDSEVLNKIRFHAVAELMVRTENENGDLNEII